MLHNTGTADTMALSVDGAQPVWMTLNEARQRAFTGEVVFETDPEVLAYLDNGMVYYAERSTDVSLGRRLLDAGVIDIAQLEQGTVRVGDIEHLGRLFDRDPSVDRDAVVVLAETSTQALIAELANGAITTVRVTAYRHHPSGVHRWFVAPLDTPAVLRPVSALAQLDTTVIDDLPGLSFTGVDTDELTIEWDDQIGETVHVASNGGFDVSLRTVGEPSVDMARAFDGRVFELSLDLVESIVHTDETSVERTDSDTGTDTGTDTDIDTGTGTDTDIDTGTGTGTDTGTDTETADDLAGFDFSVVWPDGSEQLATNGTAVTSEPEPIGGAVPSPGDVAPSFTQLEVGDLQFEMPTLVLTDEPELADADVPDDVAEAVRRAIAAIESASVAAPHVAPQPEVATRLPEIAPIDPAGITPAEITPAGITPAEITTVVQTVAAAPAVALGRFAAPTMATSVEVMYAQLADDFSSVDTATYAASPTFAESPAGGIASVVFIDEPVEEENAGGNDRSSALRRLISGLRRKDH